MKRKLLFIGIFSFLLICGIFSVNAQDIIVLKDGNMLEARVMELSPTEIRYKRFDHLDGPTVVIPAANVLSIRYENGKVEVFSDGTLTEQTDPQGNVSQELYLTSTGIPVLLQNTLNLLPPVPVAGNNLKFEFAGEGWIAKINGENFLAGIIEYETNEEGGILTLKQTHIWLGTAGKTAGRIAGMIPGGETVGSALTVAGSVAGAVGAVEAAGPVIVLEYIKGPPASLKLVSYTDTNEKEPRVRNQSEKSANSRNNWISLEAAAVGFGARYERMLGSYTSLGLNIYWDPFLGDSFDINAFFRVYPWGKSFFLGIGLGYYIYSGSIFVSVYYFDDYYGEWKEKYEYNYFNGNGFEFVPEIGWKIGGKVGGFYLMPSITFPVIIDDHYLSLHRFLYLGMGVAF